MFYTVAECAALTPFQPLQYGAKVQVCLCFSVPPAPVCPLCDTHLTRHGAAFRCGLPARGGPKALPTVPEFRSYASQGEWWRQEFTLRE